MKKIVRLTESDLTRIVKRVINEQEDFDHFGKIVVPQMTTAGFKMVDESKIGNLTMCKYYKGNCCKYFCYPNHNDGVNLSLNCSENGWHYVVFYKGNKMVKEFKLGVDVKQNTQDAVNYAIALKTKLFPPKG